MFEELLADFGAELTRLEEENFTTQDEMVENLSALNHSNIAVEVAAGAATVSFLECEVANLDEDIFAIFGRL